MIRVLDESTWETRAQFLADIREFFRSREVLEVETPLLNPQGTVEPFLDPFVVARRAGRKSPEAVEQPGDRFLITSPEYNLKVLLAALRRDLFQIAHCFREGDSGGEHTEEFLMLEWYRIGRDESALMEETAELVDHLSRRPYGRVRFASPLRRTVADLFGEYCGCGLARDELETAVSRHALLGPDEKAEHLRYDELFFTLFLNRVEPNLDGRTPTFVCDYPPELAALSVVENGRARRFELYWQGRELANGYYELGDAEEQSRRFAAENELRVALGKERMEPNPQLLEALRQGLPECAGIAVGLDRLLLALVGGNSLSEVSPFV